MGAKTSKPRTPKTKGKKEPAKPGRPTLYTPELAQTICARLAAGESLRAICTEEEMPSRETVREWLHKDEAFAGQYARAREEQQVTLAEEVLEEARAITSQADAMKVREFGNHVRWMAERMAPKVFGAKQDLHITGDFEKLSEAELMEKVRGLMSELNDGTGSE